MVQGLYQSGSSMLARSTRQHLITNNIANSDTPGFKRDGVFIKELGETLGKGRVEVIRVLRKEYPRTAVIAISGGGHVAELELFPQARALGVHLTMTKPFHLKELLSYIAEAGA